MTERQRRKEREGEGERKRKRERGDRVRGEKFDRKNRQ